MHINFMKNGQNYSSDFCIMAVAKRPMALQMKMGYQIDDKTLLDLHLMPDLPQGDSKGVYFIGSYWSKLGTVWRTYLCPIRR